MLIEQRYWTATGGWKNEGALCLDGKASLLLVFASTSILDNRSLMDEVRRQYPGTPLVGCSTAGEICGISVRDNSMVVTAIRFEHTTLKLVKTSIAEAGDSLKAGTQLAQTLAHGQLQHVLVLSDGLQVNGTKLAQGLRTNLPDTVAVTGGLAGDGANFKRTLVCADAETGEGVIAAVGFYGTRLKVAYGSLGGWDSFGAQRLITRSHGNILYELDGRSALALYKEYLGEHAEGLPATGLLFPLALRVGENDDDLVRTVLSVNENDQSMTFAGDMPEGSYARLMKANFDRLIDGAAGAAHSISAAIPNPQLALLISCVGRKLVLKQRVEEEVESVRDVLGKDTVLAGFYSYGEICPQNATTQCELHNQTMTITTFTES